MSTFRLDSLKLYLRGQHNVQLSNKTSNTSMNFIKMLQEKKSLELYVNVKCENALKEAL